MSITIQQQFSFETCGVNIDYKTLMIILTLIVTIPSTIIFGIVIIKLALGLF